MNIGEHPVRMMLVAVGALLAWGVTQLPIEDWDVTVDISVRTPEDSLAAVNLDLKWSSQGSQRGEQAPRAIEIPAIDAESIREMEAYARLMEEEARLAEARAREIEEQVRAKLKSLGCVSVPSPAGPPEAPATPKAYDFDFS